MVIWGSRDNLAAAISKTSKRGKATHSFFPFSSDVSCNTKLTFSLVECNVNIVSYYFLNFPERGEKMDVSALGNEATDILDFGTSNRVERSDLRTDKLAQMTAAMWSSEWNPSDPLRA